MHGIGHRAAIAAFLGAVAAVWLSASAAAESTRYDLKTTIEPEAGTIAVEGSIELPAGEPQLRFLLHRTFDITRMTVNGGNAAVTYEDGGPFPFVHTVVVALPAADRPLHIEIAYHGRLQNIPEWGAAPDQRFGMDDQINGKLVYLSIGSFWYPRLGPWGQRFDTQLLVSLPKGWAAVSSGSVRTIASVPDRAVTQWSVRDNMDAVVVASPSFKRLTAKGVELYYVQMPTDVVTAEAGKTAAVMALFRDRLGDAEIPGGVVRHVYAPLAHGQGRAGIARPGLIVTSEGRMREAMAADAHYTLFQDVAHEIAHFWWNFGAEQGDWINEAFAEYFSALAVRGLESEVRFDRTLDGYRKGVAQLPASAPSLATVPAQGAEPQIIWTVRYQKGSLMLDAMRRAMGDEAFFAAARAFFQTYKGHHIGTAEFRAFWASRLGDQRARLDTWLDTGGAALPE